MWLLLDANSSGCDYFWMWLLLDVTTSCLGSWMWLLLDLSLSGCDYFWMWLLLDVTISGCDYFSCIHIFNTISQFRASIPYHSFDDTIHIGTHKNTIQIHLHIHRCLAIWHIFLLSISCCRSEVPWRRRCTPPQGVFKRNKINYTISYHNSYINHNSNHK